MGRYVSPRHGPDFVIERKLSVLHVEDDSLWQTCLLEALRAVPFVARVESAPTGAAGLAMATRLRPDLVLVDLSLPDVDGVVLAGDLGRLRPRPRVLLCTARRDDAVLLAASEPHVAGLLWKTGDLLAHLPAALTAATEGGKYYPPDVREALRRFRTAPSAFIKLLSPREIRLLPLFGRGDTDAEMAAALGLSVHTVRSHRQSIMRKLNLPSTPRLIHWIVVHGFAQGG